MKGESFFSYPLTRPYPFRWFTWTVAIGGIICTLLFSFVALAADGYNIDLQYKTEFNKTISKPYWFKKPPFSWIAPTQVSCQPALLTSGSSYFTRNLGFTYKIDKLWREGSNSVHNRLLPATEYSNALLEDCHVLTIEIDFLRKDQTRNAANPWNWGATTASAIVNCAFNTSNGGVRANLTTQLPNVFELDTLVSAQSFLLSSNISERADMWFGGELTFGWYNQVLLAISHQQQPVGYTTNDNVTWDSGTLVLLRNPAVADYTSLKFFFVQAYFYANNGGLSWIQPPNTLAIWADPGENSHYKLPNITTTVDTFAKCFYSLLLSDLGVTHHTNALVTPSGVRWLGNQVDRSLQDDGEIGRPSDVQNAVNETGPSYPINQIYQSVVRDLGKPPNLNATKSSTIYTQYLCSIPQRKGAGALFVSILLADLVFLQAVWTLLNLAVTWWLERHDEQANYCEGCKVSDGPVIKRKVSDYQLLQVHSRASSTVSLPVLELTEDGFFATGRDS